MGAANNPHLHRHFDRADFYREEALLLLNQFIDASRYDKDETDLLQARRYLTMLGIEHLACMKQLGK